MFTEMVYPPIYFMVKSGSNIIVPFSRVATSGQRILESSNDAVVSLTKYKLTYISGALSGSSVKLVPSSEPPLSYDGPNGQIIISPPVSTPQGSRYVIAAVAEDTLKKVYRITQNIVIMIYQGAQNDNALNELKAQMISLLQVTINDLPYEPIAKKSLWDTGMNVTAASDPDLKMKIQSIDERGNVLLVFSKPL